LPGLTRLKVPVFTKYGSFKIANRDLLIIARNVVQKRTPNSMFWHMPNREMDKFSINSAAAFCSDTGKKGKNTAKAGEAVKNNSFVKKVKIIKILFCLSMLFVPLLL